MNTPPRPRFRDMEATEVRDLLARNHVGRLAYSFHDRVDIEPIHYVCHEDWLYGRTAAGTKLDQLERNRWVAFQVDEVEDLYEWRSVVVHGAFYQLSPEGAPWEREAWESAIQSIRSLIPAAFTAADPTPFRNVVFRVAVQNASGRAATMRGKGQ
jgi:uncharacterized protein